MITLRKLRLADAANMLDWMNDQNVVRFLNISDDNKTLISIQNFIEMSQNQSVNAHFAISNETQDYLGTISLKNINLKDKHAEFAIVIPSHNQGLGYGSIALNLILKYAKEELSLHKIYLNVLDTNQAAIHIYEKFGFKQCGNFQDHIYRDGKYYSLLYFEKLIKEVIK